MGELVLPDYNDSILNLSCSILNHYGIRPKHSTLPVADQMLRRKHKHVVVIILDGLGMNVLEHNLSYRDFLRRNLLNYYSSVFPPTTTASTTSFLSGLSPIEHGWLGWDVYFEQEDKTVTCFFNKLQGTQKDAAEYNIPNKYLPYKNIIDQINESGNAKAYGIFPFGTEPHKDLHDWCNAIRNTCKNDEATFTYAYWENPDNMLHRKGSRSNDVTKMIQELNQTMLYLCESLKDTIVFITADHGHTDITNIFLKEDYPQIVEMLERKVSIEPRAISFYVKPEYKDIFPKTFYDCFGESYKLFTKQEVFDSGLFGFPGDRPNENLTGIGDYLAVATEDKTLLWSKDEVQFRSHHAGLTKDEMRIPLIYFKDKPKRVRWIVYYGIVLLIIGFLGMCLF